MDIKDALQLVNKSFVYTSDRSYYILPETWRVVGDDGRGDCEDYSLTAVWYYSDGNWLRWMWNITFGPFRFWYCTMSNGEGHMITEITRGDNAGMFFDNIQKRLVTNEHLIKKGYTLKSPYYLPVTLYKVIVGYTLGTVGRVIRKHIVKK